MEYEKDEFEQDPEVTLRKRVERERSKIKADFKEVFSTAAGERVLSYITDNICMFNKWGIEADDRKMYMREGKREVAGIILYLLKDKKTTTQQSSSALENNYQL